MGEALNDRAMHSPQPGDVWRDEEAAERWYRQAKETKRDGTGAGSLSTPIVPLKVANQHPESHRREGAEKCRVTGPRSGNTSGSPKSGSVCTKRQRIAELAAQMPEVSFMSLAHHIDVEWLKEAYRQTRKDAAVGVDGQSAGEYAVELESNLGSLLDRFKSGSYRAPPLRRVYIPKEGRPGEKRPLGISTFENKVLERAVVMLLEPIYEQDFIEGSYGFRPGRSAHMALDAIWHAVMDMQEQCWVLEADIRKYYDSMKHGHLRAFVKQRVSDGVITRMIDKWLKAGVLEGGNVHYPDEGSPQGSVISPLLSNIYLHEVLDKWFEGEIKPRLQGRSVLVRYADDFVLLFDNEQDARRVAAVLPKRFEKYGLQLHPEKTRLIQFSKPRDKDKSATLDFLGFTHYWGTSRWGRRILKRKTARGRLKRSIGRVYEWCKEKRHEPMRQQWESLCRKVQGHYNYFGITGNGASLSKYLHQVRRVWRKWLNRRSRGNHIPWSRFEQIMQRYPLPPVRIMHSYAR